MEKKREIPIEIDDHFRLFGKEPWEVDYGEKCPVCDVRIDEYGFCSCGSSGDWIFLQMVRQVTSKILLQEEQLLEILEQP